MKKIQEPQDIWTLWDRDITLQKGTLIEYQDLAACVLAARVERVRVVFGTPPYKDCQVIDVKLYGPLTRRDGRRERTVQPDQVLRVLDAPPPPPAKALTSLWSPRDGENPFRIESHLTTEEWREIARWYPFSIRVLQLSKSGNAQWQEQARTYSWANAKAAMNTLASRNREKSRLCWVVMKCERRGKEGREKPILFFPSKNDVEVACKKAAQENGRLL